MMTLEDLDDYTLQELEILSSFIQYKYEYVSDASTKAKCEKELLILFVAILSHRLMYS